jgi:hypothetical protein
MKADALVVGKGVPAWLLRAVILVTGAAIVYLPLSEGTTIGTLGLLLPAVLASVYAPASPSPAAVVIVAAVPVVHLFHVTCGIAGVLPASGRVHPRALRPTVVRFLLIQAVTAAVVVLIALLPDGRTQPLVEVLALAGLAGVALLLVWLQRRG